MRYPKEALVFEIIEACDEDDPELVRIGNHVEIGGPCCLGLGSQEWACGVLVANDGHDTYFWVSQLRPLTPAAKAMHEIAVAKAYMR